ncbi:MAG: hypothetical protein ACFFCQ_16675 [Promethearchaeota archaeon]
MSAEDELMPDEEEAEMEKALKLDLRTPKKKPIREITLDLWKTRLHRDRMGIKKQEEFMSKSRQWNRDLTQIGDLKEKGQDIGKIAIRDGFWNDVKEEKNRRLVLKLFSDAISWLGTCEEMVSEELEVEYARTKTMIKHAVKPIFRVVSAKYPYVTPLSSVRKRIFSFHKVDDEDKVVELFTLRETRWSRGDDWHVYSSRGDVKVADVDGKLFDIGGEYTVRIYEEELAKDRMFMNVLIFFAASRRYQDDIRKKISTIRKDILKGRFTPRMTKAELNLATNPRRVRR